MSSGRLNSCPCYSDLSSQLKYLLVSFLRHWVGWKGSVCAGSSSAGAVGRGVGCQLCPVLDPKAGQ